MQERLWSPWRSQYIEGPKGLEGDGACVFCTKANDVQRDAERMVVLRGKTAYACMNLFPYNAGHLLVNPYRHVAGLEELTTDEYRELFEMVRDSQALLVRALSPGGFNIGINLGAAAGAGIAGHLHVHVIPRWGGDTNFMPTAAEVRVISQNMQDCYDRILRARA